MLLLNVSLHYPFSHYLVADNKVRWKMLFSLLAVLRHRANI